MRADTTVNVTLSRELYQFVKSAVRSGRYTSASDVVQDALRETRDAALREVQRKIEEGLESARRGELLDGNGVFLEIRRRSAQRRTAAKARR